MEPAGGDERIRVLLAEDDPLAQQAIEVYLDHAPDIELIGVANNGLAALELALRVPADVAIVDIHLPSLDGVELTRRLTAEAFNLAVLCFTALASDEVLLAGVSWLVVGG